MNASRISTQVNNPRLMVSNRDELDTWSFSADSTRHLEKFFCHRRLKLDIWRNFVGVQTSLEAGRRPAGKNFRHRHLIRPLEDFLGSFDITRHLTKFCFVRPKKFCPLYQLSCQVGSILHRRLETKVSLVLFFHNACFIWFLVC